MKDQAALLRQLMAVERQPEPPRSGGPSAVVVGSGKGGVGKSLLALGLAQVMAAEGCESLLVEGNQNLGSLAVMLGVRPAGRLEDLLDARADPVQLLTRVSEKLWLLPGDSGAEALYGLRPTEQARLHQRLSTVYSRFAAVVVDGGGGIESVVRVAAMRAGRLLVVVTPEPAALSDGFALIKVMTAQMRDLPIDIVVNRALDDREARLAHEKLQVAAERFLRRGLRRIGTIPEDATMRAVSRGRLPLFGPDPAGPAAAAIRDIALVLLREGLAAPAVSAMAVMP